MGFRSFLALMGCASALAWIAWGFVLFRVNPLEAGILGLVLFYCTLFVGCIGLFFLLGLGYRYWVSVRPEMMIREVGTSFRQGILLALVCVLSLGLSALSHWSWGVFILTILLASVIEYAFMAVQRR